MMTEYTPTTEEVRRCYGDIHCSDLDAGSLEHHVCPEEADFDRWLNEIRAEAWDEGHGYPCDKWVRSEMCREYHRNPYLPIEK